MLCVARKRSLRPAEELFQSVVCLGVIKKRLIGGFSPLGAVYPLGKKIIPLIAILMRETSPPPYDNRVDLSHNILGIHDLDCHSPIHCKAGHS